MDNIKVYNRNDSIEETPSKQESVKTRYTQELEAISLSEKIHGCKSHIRSLELKLSKVEYDHNRIPLKKTAAYNKIMKYALPTIMVSIIVIACLVFTIMQISSIVRAGKGGTSGDGIAMLLGLLIVFFGGYGCIWLWIRVVRLIQFIKDLEFQEILLTMKMDSLKTKMEERKVEMEELLRRQDETSREIRF